MSNRLYLCSSLKIFGTIFAENFLISKSSAKIFLTISLGQESQNKVIFKDKSKYNILGSDERKEYGEKSTELETINLSEIVKHGDGGVVVQGAMMASGAGELDLIESIIDRFVYLSILKQ